MDSSCFLFFSSMLVLTLELCARLSSLLVSFQVHIKSLHIIIIIIIIFCIYCFHPHIFLTWAISYDVQVAVA